MLLLDVFLQGFLLVASQLQQNIVCVSRIGDKCLQLLCWQHTNVSISAMEYFLVAFESTLDMQSWEERPHEDV